MPARLIRAAELNDLIGGGAPLVIADARPVEEYERLHIEGALSIEWESFCEVPADCGSALKEPGYWGKLDSDESLQKRLSRLGLKNDVPVAVYADMPHSKGREGRIAWMLLYLGVENVYLLDGGFRGWLQAENPVSDERRALAPSRFQINTDGKRRVTIDELSALLSATPDACLVDTRSKDEFEGRIYSYQPRMGRLPSSVNIPYLTLFDENGFFLGKDEFLDLTSSLCKSEPALTYCEVGVRAATYSLIYEIYTDKKLPVYDGSIMEWSLDAGLPVVRD